MDDKISSIGTATPGIETAGTEKSRLSPKVLAKIDQQAAEFESMFMAQMMQFMWQDVGENNYFNGGTGEETWRQMLIEQYGDVASKTGELGIASSVRAELIKAQEKLLPPAPVTPDAAAPATVDKGEKA